MWLAQNQPGHHITRCWWWTALLVKCAHCPASFTRLPMLTIITLTLLSNNKRLFLPEFLRTSNTFTTVMNLLSSGAGVCVHRSAGYQNTKYENHQPTTFRLPHHMLHMTIQTNTVYIKIPEKNSFSSEHNFTIISIHTVVCGKYTFLRLANPG